MPLRILIVGAGIAGFSCAIALAQQGHEIELFEKSAFSNEIGAAYHSGPYAVKIFKQWGLDVKTMKPVVVQSWEDRDCDDPHKVLESKFVLEEKKREYGIDPSLNEIMHHRADGHRALREFALAMPNVKLHLSSCVSDIDPRSGTITLKNGKKCSGDLVIGADGIHSKTVECIDSKAAKTTPIGINMYRFLVPTDLARADPEVREILDAIDFPHRHSRFVHASTKRSLVLYSCKNGDLINCATFQMANDDLVSMPEGDYNCQGSVDAVLHVMKGWPKGYLALARLAEDVKHWAVISRDVPYSSVKGRLALVGDAAHPTQPTWAAGANMGVEDAAVLGVLLDSKAQSEDIEERLVLFNKLRYSRTTTVKYVSDMPNLEWVGLRKETESKLQAKVPGAEIPRDMLKYLWTFDAVEDAEQAMAKIC